MLARYNGPSLARFLSVDPLGSSVRPELPQSWNRYTYVQNNPINSFDPDGMKDRRTEEDKKILNDADVQQSTQEAWTESKPEAHPDKRQEVTFTIVDGGGNPATTERKTDGNPVSSTPVKIGAQTKAVLEGSQAGKTALADVHTHPGVGTAPINPDTQQRQFVASGASKGDKETAANRGVTTYMVEKNKMIKLTPAGKQTAILTGKDFKKYMGRLDCVAAPNCRVGACRRSSRRRNRRRTRDGQSP